MNNKFPSQPQLNFQSRDATPEEIEEWQNEASDYHETVKNVMGAVIAGSRDATPEEIEEWQNEASDYHETVKNVMGAVIAGSFFQFFTLGSMILAFYIIHLGLDGGL